MVGMVPSGKVVGCLPAVAQWERKYQYSDTQDMLTIQWYSTLHFYSNTHFKKPFLWSKIVSTLTDELKCICSYFALATCTISLGQN